MSTQGCAVSQLSFSTSSQSCTGVSDQDVEKTLPSAKRKSLDSRRFQSDLRNSFYAYTMTVAQAFDHTPFEATLQKVTASEEETHIAQVQDFADTTALNELAYLLTSKVSCKAPDLEEDLNVLSSTKVRCDRDRLLASKLSSTLGNSCLASSEQLLLNSDLNSGGHRLAFEWSIPPTGRLCPPQERSETQITFFTPPQHRKSPPTKILNKERVRSIHCSPMSSARISCPGSDSTNTSALILAQREGIAASKRLDINDLKDGLASARECLHTHRNLAEAPQKCSNSHLASPGCFFSHSLSRPYIRAKMDNTIDGVEKVEQCVPRSVRVDFTHPTKQVNYNQVSREETGSATEYSQVIAMHPDSSSTYIRSSTSGREQKSQVVFTTQTSEPKAIDTQRATFEHDVSHNPSLLSVKDSEKKTTQSGKRGNRILSEASHVLSTRAIDNGPERNLSVRKKPAPLQKGPSKTKELKPRDEVAKQAHSSRKRLNLDHARGRKNSKVSVPFSRKWSGNETKILSRQKSMALPQIKTMSTLASNKPRPSMTLDQAHFGSVSSCYRNRSHINFFTLSFVLLICSKWKGVLRERRRLTLLNNIEKPRASYTIQCAWRRSRRQIRLVRWCAARFLADWLRFRLVQFHRRRVVNVRILSEVLSTLRVRLFLRSELEKVKYNIALDMIRSYVRRSKAQKVLAQLRFERDERNMLVLKCYHATLHIIRKERLEFMRLQKEAEQATHTRSQVSAVQYYTESSGCTKFLPDIQDRSDFHTNILIARHGPCPTGISDAPKNLTKGCESLALKVDVPLLASISDNSSPSHAIDGAGATAGETLESFHAGRSALTDEEVVHCTGPCVSHVLSRAKRMSTSPPRFPFELQKAQVKGSLEGIQEGKDRSAIFFRPTCNNASKRLHRRPSCQPRLPFTKRDHTDDHNFLNSLFTIENDSYLDAKHFEKGHSTERNLFQGRAHPSGYHRALSRDSIEDEFFKRKEVLSSETVAPQKSLHDTSSSNSPSEGSYYSSCDSHDLVHNPPHSSFTLSAVSKQQILTQTKIHDRERFSASVRSQGGVCSNNNFCQASLDLLVRMESIERRILLQELFDQQEVLLLPVKRLNLALHLCSSGYVPPFFASLFFSMKDEKTMRKSAKLFVQEHNQRISITEVYDSLSLPFLLRPMLSMEAERRRRKLVQDACAAPNPIIDTEEKQAFLGSATEPTKSVREGVVLKPAHLRTEIDRTVPNGTCSNTLTFTEASARSLDAAVSHSPHQPPITKMNMQPSSQCKVQRPRIGCEDIPWPHDTDRTIAAAVEMGRAVRMASSSKKVTPMLEKREESAYSYLTASTTHPLDAYIHKALKSRYTYFGCTSEVPSMLPPVTQRCVQPFASNPPDSDSMSHDISLRGNAPTASHDVILPDIKQCSHGALHIAELR